MKQLNSQINQTKLRIRFIKSGVKMIGPETIFFSKDTKIGKNVTAKVISRKNLQVGDQIKGPAIISEDETTVVVSSDFIATVGSDKCLTITKKITEK